jgi:hypothetical protein
VVWWGGPVGVLGEQVELVVEDGGGVGDDAPAAVAEDQRAVFGGEGVAALV